MNLLFRVIFAHGCRSTHHKLAMDALGFLRCPNHQLWQRVFLKQHGPYLRGAKAPDAEFKDFRNHVLHVRDNYWGGAPKAARVWYDKTVDALRRNEWETAVYNAGVLSHYYSDPIQPFHTGQTTAENNIHRATEWSITKSYTAIRQVLVDRGRYPAVTVPQGKNWVEEMVARGAERANRYYEELVDRYDIARGTHNPPAGLDQTSREFLALLLGHATVGFARILDQAFSESNAVPPEVDITLQGFLATLTIPIRWVSNKLHDREERKLVEAMYHELQTTGKVENTLPEDDLVVRELHRQEITECKPTLHTTETASGFRDTSGHPPKEPRRRISGSAGATPQPIRDARLRTDPPAPRLRFFLDAEDDIVDAPSIGKKTALRLNRIGIQTVADLLRASPTTIANQLKLRYVTSQTVSGWQDQASLACQVPGIRGHDAQILIACGWMNPSEIAGADPKKMFPIVDAFMETAEGRRIIRSGRRPDLNEITDWIGWAAHARPLRAA